MFRKSLSATFKVFLNKGIKLRDPQHTLNVSTLSSQLSRPCKVLQIFTLHRKLIFNIIIMQGSRLDLREYIRFSDLGLSD